MKWYGNLKIGAKLAVGFGLIVALVVALSTYSIITAKSIDSDYSYLIEFPQHRFDTMSEIKTEFVNARRSLSHMNVFSGLDDSQVTAQLNNIDTILTQINVKLQEYNSLVTNDNRLTDSEKNDRTQAVTKLQGFISEWRSDLVKPVYQACLDGNRQEVITLSSKYASLSNGVIDSIDDLYNKAKDIADNLNVSTTASANRSILILVAISIIIVIISVLLAVLITSFITKPIKRLVSLVSEVSQGNININTDRANISKDETGELTLDVYILTDVIKTIISDITQLTREIMVNGDMDYRIEVSQYKGSYHEMTSGINDFANGYIEEINQFLTLLDGISNGDFNADMKKMPGKKAIINNNVDALKKNLENVSADLSTLTKSAGEGKLNIKADVGKYRGDWAEILNGLNHLMEVIAAPIQEAADVLKEVSAGNFDQKMQGNYLGDFLIIKDSINNTVTNIASYIDEISDVLAELSKKNLDQSITREYVGKFSNIKVALVNIINTLNNVISEIKSAAEQVAAGARQISESSMTLAQGATEQASSIEELNATVLTINESTKQNAESAKQAENLSDSSKVNAARGDQDMSSMLVSMDSIKESSNSISRIIKVIEDIAFQTNLLALNAAVEAARAGEHGKGFAVVAEEVRTLAGRSKNAAKETSDLIEESINRVNEGTKIAGQTAGALQTIVGDVTKVAEIITGIAEASAEQATSIKEVTEGISQITDVVQNNSATSEEAASASQQLSSQAEMLQSMVEEFKLR